jgi:hypothetical protein
MSESFAPPFTKYRNKAQPGEVKCSDCIFSIGHESYTGRQMMRCETRKWYVGPIVARNGTCQGAVIRAMKEGDK